MENFCTALFNFLDYVFGIRARKSFLFKVDHSLETTIRIDWRNCDLRITVEDNRDPHDYFVNELAPF